MHGRGALVGQSQLTSRVAESDPRGTPDRSRRPRAQRRPCQRLRCLPSRRQCVEPDPRETLRSSARWVRKRHRPIAPYVKVDGARRERDEERVSIRRRDFHEAAVRGHVDVVRCGGGTSRGGPIPEGPPLLDLLARVQVVSRDEVAEPKALPIVESEEAAEILWETLRDRRFEPSERRLRCRSPSAAMNFGNLGVRICSRASQAASMPDSMGPKRLRRGLDAGDPGRRRAA